MSREDRATSGHGLSRCDLLKTTAGAAVVLLAAAEIIDPTIGPSPQRSHDAGGEPTAP